MFACPPKPPTRRRLLLCLLLLASLLVAGAGVFPASGQTASSVEKDTVQRYWWINAGGGAGRTGIGPTVVGGIPVGNRLFVGGRYVETEEFVLRIFTPPNPSATTLDAGPLVGLVEQGRWGHLSLAGGITVVWGRRPDEPETKSSTFGVPLDVQAVFTPVRYVGIGVQGYANVNSGDNMLGWSVQLQVRIPK